MTIKTDFPPINGDFPPINGDFPPINGERQFGKSYISRVTEAIFPYKI